MVSSESGTSTIESDQWPSDAGPYVVLVDASSSTELSIIEKWVGNASAAATGPVDYLRLPASRRRRPFASVDPRIDERLAEQDDPLLIPVRVVWLARERDGVRRVTLKDAIRFGDPRDPNALQQQLILARHPERCRVVVGEPARRSEIEKRWAEPSGHGPADGTSLGEFVALKAWLALERSERHIRGQRYKVPRFLREDLFWSRPFQAGVERLSKAEGKPLKRLEKRTHRYLKEIAAQHSPYVIDLVNAITSTLIKAAHQSVDYSEQELRDTYALGETDPLVFLPSHKSNFDHLVLQHVLFENELPLNHTAGGINMNFFLIGPLLRRSGIFFIRREFKTNAAYKFVLRQYLDYLLEKRFALEWYVEGGRSRTGKLREPRLGLLAYIADAYQRGIADDVVLVPVSINYDQITDVASYAAEQRGKEKEEESFVWAMKFITGLRKSHGSIHVRFGEPLPLSSRIGREEDLSTPEGKLALPKVAFEVSTRINDVTPITAISLVTLALLSGQGKGFTVRETIDVLQPFIDFVEQRNLPTTFVLPFHSEAAVEGALEALRANGVVHRTDGLTATVYSIGPEQHLEAAYYRNTVIHFFVNTGITELALAIGVLAGKPMDEESVIDRAVELRDLFKFEFFFAPTSEFVEEIRSELDRYRVGPRDAEGPVAVDVAAMMPPKSPVVLRPFLEAYFVVASALATFGDDELTADDLSDASLAMGEQLLSQRVIKNTEAVSTTLFSSAILVVENRDLLSAQTADRRAFLDEIAEALVAVTSVADRFVTE
ncbi:MAG: glycerol-3-phosphate 1-O-acyltransferase [Acidimicrobiia bacterium]